MDWAEKSKLQIEKWLVTARWFYATAILLIVGLPWILTLTPETVRELFSRFDLTFLSSFEPSRFPILALFFIAILVNIVFDVWIYILEHRWRLLKKITIELRVLSFFQIIFDLLWLTLVIYLGQISPIVYPLFYFIPIVESIILFSLWGPIIVGIVSALLVTGVGIWSRFGLTNLDSSLYSEIFQNLSEFLTPSIAVTIIYLVIGFFGAYLSGVVKERGEILARDSSSIETIKKKGQELANQAKFQERKMTATELELSLANQKLRELDQSRSKFVAVTTHQMRTPLAGIKWTFNMLESGQLGALSEEAETFIKKGAEGTEHLIKIVNDLLTVDQVDAGDTDLKLETTSPVELLNQVVSEFSNQAASKRINLSFVKPDWGVPNLSIDKQKVKVVMENLIDNAIKYSSFGGQVTVMIIGDRLNSANPQLEFTISDSGIGINPSDQAKIFHKFYRGGGAIKVEPDGTGIGLYICRDIIEKHRGTIWYENRPAGGTVFHFTLPVNQKQV